LRARTCADSGRTRRATPKSNVDTTRELDAGFSKTCVFFVRLRLFWDGAWRRNGHQAEDPRRVSAHRQRRQAVKAAGRVPRS